MRSLKLSSLVVLSLAMGGCQTPYQEIGATGGVSAFAITNDTFRISSRGNGYTDPTLVQDYSLLKAAETTLQSGGTHFLVITGKDTTNRSFGQTPGTFNTNVYGNTTFTTYNPGITYDIVKPGEDLLIQVLKVPTGTNAPVGAFDAQQVFDNINPRVVRPKKSKV